MDMIDNDCVMIAFCSLNFYVRLATMHNTRVLSTKTSTVLRLRNASFFRFCPRSLLCLDPAIVDKIPGKQNDRKTLLGELNWIFTAITDTIAWNVLPRGEEFRIL
jgi:regulator-associated protein of mTOR